MPNFSDASIVVLVTLLCPWTALSQTPALQTDRPDFTESPFVVPLGSIQLEAGLAMRFGQRVDETSGPEALIRWSPTRRFEIRFAPPGYVHGESLRGYTDVSIGTKIEAGRFRNWNVGVIASLGLPTGDEEVSVGRPTPGLILAAGRNLTDAWTVGTQGSVVRSGVGEGVVLASTLVVGRALTSNLGVFLEVAAAREPNAATLKAVHSGVTWLPSPLLQLDIHATRELARTGGAHAVGLGMSTRFD